MGKIMHKGVNYSNSAERNKSLNDLADVVISSPVDGQAPVYNGTTQQWENKAVSASATLEGLTDTNITNPTDGQVPIYDSATLKWVNGTAQTSTTLAGLTDTTITNPTTGQVPVYDATIGKWVNNTVPNATNAGTATVANSVACGSNSITFGVDAQGNYGYIKPGADTVTPFKQVTTREEPNAAGGNTFYIDTN